jgi:hypothetical protein
MAASLRELAFRLLYIRRLGAGIRRRLTPFRKVRGLDEKARGDLRICGGLCKVQKGGRLFGEKFFARHLSGSRYYPSPKANTPQRRIRSREKYKSERKAAVPEIMPGAHHR